MASSGQGSWLSAAVALLALGAAAVAFWPEGPRQPATAGDGEPEAEALEPIGEPGPRPEARATAPEAVDPGPQAPPLRAGQRLEVVLAEAAAQQWGGAASGTNEEHYRALLRAIAGPEAVFAPELGRAAREFVYSASLLGRSPPSDVREFLLRGAGALAGDTTFQHATTSSDSEATLRRVIRDAVAEPLDGDGPLVVGVGEVFVPGARASRHIGVVATRLPIALQPVPRSVAVGATLRLRGRLLVPVRDLEVITLREDGRTPEARLDVRGDALEIAIELGPGVGALDLQIVGELPRGPGKLVQLRVEVGRPPPERETFVLAGDEAGLRDAKDATALAWRLLNDDRVRAGLPALAWDARLAEVAEAHSREMRDGGFFGHRSPTTGLPADRLARAGYAAVRSAENLAMNVSVAEAERGLMASLGHRRNLLGRGFTHGAVGVVGEEREGGGRRWWLTQLFSRPMVAIDADAEVDALIARIDASRRGRQLPPLRVVPALQAVGREIAPRVASGPLDGLGGEALELARSRGGLGQRLRAFVAHGAELAQIDMPEAALAASARRLGVGVAQERTADGVGKVGVVVLVGD